MAQIIDFQAKRNEKLELMNIYQEMKKEELRRKKVAFKKLLNKLFTPFTPKHKDYTNGIKG